MCGRFSLTTAEKQVLLNRFDLEEIPFELKPRYNIAPSQDIPIIQNTNPKILTQARWGLIPSWAKDESLSFKMINARAETVNEKPAYKKPFEQKRCLIPADSYYEWDKVKNTKTPYRIMLKNEEIFSFAGIWETWNKDGKSITSCSIITTEPNELMKKIHIRMPVILSKDKEKDYLNNSPEKALKLLKPFNATKMKMYQISDLVNSPKNDSIEVIKEVKKSTLADFLS